MTLRDASLLAMRVLSGVGLEAFEWREDSEIAIHVRRRLDPNEATVLYRVKPSCPVFSSGKAMSYVLSA